VEEHRARPVAILAVGLTAALELASVVLSWGLESKVDTLLYAAYAVTMAGAGAMILTRHPPPATRATSSERSSASSRSSARSPRTPPKVGVCAGRSRAGRASLLPS